MISLLYAAVVILLRINAVKERQQLRKNKNISWMWGDLSLARFQYITVKYQEEALRMRKKSFHIFCSPSHLSV
jgi:hypothetical protein